MAIITEEEDDQQQLKRPLKETTTKPPTAHKPTSSSKPSSNKSPESTASSNPFTFWFYFTIGVSLVTLAFISLSSLSPQDPKSWFLSLPNALRQHYAKGRSIKVQPHPNQSPIEVFSMEQGPAASENVVLVHGLGLSSYSFRDVLRSLGKKGVHAVAIDLPGHGFSEKSAEVEREGTNGILGRFWDVYSEIQEKGLFWAFDQIVETGQIPYEEIESRIAQRKVSKPIELGPEEIGMVLEQSIETLGLAPVHLVLHDSALGMTANWILKNSQSLRSITLIDTSPKSLGALPLCVLKFPVLREIMFGFSFTYSWLIKSCCSRNFGALDAEAHRVLMKSKDAKSATVGMGKKLNYSFDIAEWGRSDELKGVPLKVLWSSSWSKEWTEEGGLVANALPQATFVTHSGGRWPQEDVVEQLAETIAQFVSSLPPSVRKVKEEPIPEHIQKMFDEAEKNGHPHHHHHHHGGASHDHYHDGHGHGHADYMDAYGLGQGHAW